MRILLIGASGLIGSALLPRLLAADHSVTAVCRHPGAVAERLHWQAIDMAERVAPADWAALLAGVELVINCAGLLREQAGQHFAAVHIQAPAALFAACETAGVWRVIQLSALGADLAASTEYWRSKAAGDAALQASQLDWAIVRPSLVYADGGESSALFRRMAVAPCLLVPAAAGAVQPIHLDDLVDLLLLLVATPVLAGRTIAAVGPQALAWADYLQALRQGMAMPAAKSVRLPMPLVRLASHCTSRLAGNLLTPASLAMLRQGSTADAAAIHSLLHRALRQPSSFTHPTLRADAVLASWLPIGRWVLAFIWLFTAATSLWNTATGLRLLAEAGLPASWHWPALWLGAGVDALLGVLTLARPSRRLWQSQIALVLAYTAFISACLPGWWLHPFGPISKNLPILWLLAVLAAMERRH